MDNAEARELQLQQLFSAMLRDGILPERWDPVVIYGDRACSMEDPHVRWLVERLQSWQGAKRPGGSAGRLAGFERTKEVWLLGCGFREFRDTYGILCGTTDDTANMVPLPFRIDETLFTGSRALPRDERVLVRGAAPAHGARSLARSLIRRPAIQNALSITHLIVDKDTAAQQPHWRAWVEKRARGTGAPLDLLVCDVPDPPAASSEVRRAFRMPRSR